jgi:hypothetical protein
MDAITEILAIGIVGKYILEQRKDLKKAVREGLLIGAIGAPIVAGRAIWRQSKKQPAKDMQNEYQKHLECVRKIASED